MWSPFALYGIKPTDRVGIVGIGGLGHLAIQFAAKMGCEVVVFSSSESKREDALKLGATEYHVLTAESSLEGIKQVNHMLLCGSAQPDFKRYVKSESQDQEKIENSRGLIGLSRIIDLTATAGRIYALIVSFDTSAVPMMGLLARGISIQGSAGAPRAEIQKMLEFAVRNDVKPTIMKWPLTTKGVEEAMQALREGKMRYRGVLVAQE